MCFENGHGLYAIVNTTVAGKGEIAYYLFYGKRK